MILNAFNYYTELFCSACFGASFYFIRAQSDCYIVYVAKMKTKVAWNKI